jgi:hypothetical protein
MSFRFTVRRATKVAGVYALEGTLEEGEIRHGATASVETPEGTHQIVVRTVAFVTPPRYDRKDLTITIAPPSFAIDSLNGATLSGE